jgi:predicted naringenin-chalcone synthase
MMLRTHDDEFAQDKTTELAGVDPRRIAACLDALKNFTTEEIEEGLQVLAWRVENQLMRGMLQKSVCQLPKGSLRRDVEQFLKQGSISFLN